MPKKSINKSLFYSGIVITLLSVIMLIYAVSMFTARGNYSKLSVKISEICLVFWSPLFYLGILILIISLILMIITNKKSSNQ